MVAVLVGMALVYRFFPSMDDEQARRAVYHAENSVDRVGATEVGVIHVPRPGRGPALVPGHVAAPEELA